MHPSQADGDYRQIALKKSRHLSLKVTRNAKIPERDISTEA
jgi:hypothetical protein